MSKKIRFNKAYTTPDPDNFIFQPGEVAEFSDSDADRLVSDEYGNIVPPDTRFTLHIWCDGSEGQNAYDVLDDIDAAVRASPDFQETTAYTIIHRT